MFNLYTRIVKRGFALFFQSTAKWRNVFLVLAAVALPVASFISQASGKFVMEMWGGLPTWIALVPLAVLLFYGILRANYEEFRVVEQKVEEKDGKISSLEDRLSPKMEIIFDDQQYASCRMEWMLPESQTGSVTGTETKVRLFRVGIKNTSSSTIEGVVLQLKSFQPTGAPFLPISMRFMHDHTEGNVESRQGTTLRPGETRFVDIVAKAQNAEQMAWQYAVPNTPNMSPIGEYSLVLEALGENVVPTQAQFSIRPDDENLFLFSPD